MKVYIGPYIDCIGPYQLSDLLRYVGFSESRCDKVGCFLDRKGLGKFCEWVYGKRKRKIHVKLHPYDTWNMDITLAHLIVPLLKQMQEQKQGSPMIDDDDLAKLNITEQNIHERYDAFLREIIWAFEVYLTDWEEDYYTDNNVDRSFISSELEDKKELTHKIRSRFEMFGKYYMMLWS
jgi:hypothetical protein|tara:strand:+ start:310 stop:843 length:534 start_codon:yes stop_codon:yes gene_type:complete